MIKNNITYLDQFIPYGIFSIMDPYIHVFEEVDSIELTKFLIRLDIYKTYVVSIELVYSWLCMDHDHPTILLSKPIIVTKHSNTKVIS